MRVISRRIALRIAAAVVGAATVVGGVAAGPGFAAPTLGTVAPQSADGGGRHWVTAYSASMQGPSTLGDFGAETLSGYEYTKTAQEIVPPPTTFSDETIRQVQYLHHSGDAVRLQLSNLFGAAPTTLPAVTVGIRQGESGGAVEEGTQRAVTFGSDRSVTIPAGGSVLSDPVDLPVEAFDHLVTSIFVPAGNPPASVHGNAQQTFFTGSGDLSGQPGDEGFTERGIVLNNYTATFTTASYYVAGIQVDADPEARTLVTFGDSITDGFLSSGNTDTRYPDFLARRLQANPSTDHLSVANQAISGGRVLRDGIGPSALHRFEREVLDQPNVAGVIFLQGINDFGTALYQLPAASAEEIIAGYRELAARAHAHDIPIFIGTLTPSGNLARPAPYGTYSTPDTVAKRAQVNEWLRTEGPDVFDGVIDYDAAIRDPLIPDWIQLRYDAGDNLHPNDAGYEAMADTVPLEFLAELSH
ncbi:MAG: hypothetical protein GEV09_18590 [Pseudonocardiaceae bacterium]|nr:hypothetical protein [Pseudonocardiaceae bacterium]